MLQFPPIPRRVAYHAEGSVSELTKVFSPSAMATGPETETFETEAAATLGVKRAVAVPSARYALRVLLKCLGLPAGGEVVLPAYTDPSMPEAIVRAGLKPVFVDIRTTDDNMNEDEAAAKINSNTCAILATHIFGNPCAIDRLASLARKYCLALIEDFSHSVGARFGGKYVGTFGTAGICTFNSSKFFNTFGGGLLLTNDEAVAERILSERNLLPAQTPLGLLKSAALSFGIGVATSQPLYPLIVYPAQRILSASRRDMYAFYKKTYSVWKNTPHEVGFTDIQAKLGRRFMQNFATAHNKRITRSLRLDAALKPEIERIRTVPPGDGIFWLYIIRGGSNSDEADLLQRKLLSAGIDTGRRFLAHAAAQYEKPELFPNTQRSVDVSVQLPNHPNLSDVQIDKIATAVNKHIRF